MSSRQPGLQSEEEEASRTSFSALLLGALLSGFFLPVLINCRGKEEQSGAVDLYLPCVLRLSTCPDIVLLA